MFHLTPLLLSLASGSCCWFSWWLFSVEQWSSASNAAWGDSKMVPEDAPWLFLLLETWTPFMVSYLHTSRCPLWKPYSFVWAGKLIYEKQICKHRTRYSLLRTQGMHWGESLNEKTSEEDSKLKKKNVSWGSDSELSMGIELIPKHSVNKQKGKGTQGWPLQVKAWFKVQKSISGLLMSICPTLCSFTKLTMPHLPTIILNNAFQIVCFQCRVWETWNCVSECQYSCPFSPDTLAVSWSSLLPTPTPKPCPFYYFFVCIKR